MERYLRICERLHNLTFAPMVLFNRQCEILKTWPEMPADYMDAGWPQLLLEDFLFQGRDPRNPLISYIEPGYFLGLAEPEPDLFVLVGLVSPFEHARQETLAFCAPVIRPSFLQTFTDLLLQTPLMNLFQVRDLLCLLTELIQGEPLPPENVLFNDFTHSRTDSGRQVDRMLFEAREEDLFHVPTEFEEAVCTAIERGSPELLVRRLSSPVRGRIGRMSTSELRQEKYSFICLATLVSRAAIRGGLDPETAFNLSDLYCQRADVLNDVDALHHLSYSMMEDYCRRVLQVRSKSGTSAVIQKCLEYISVHLHEPLGLEELSSVCGLCTRSLSQRFKKEVGMGVPEYIHREKLQEAKYLLKHTDYTLAQIAAYLNYPSQSYFTQIFRRYTEQTPQQYREAPGA